jgi:hypothetical protein
MRSKDIIKGVVYDRGTATLDGVTKHLTLVAMVIASDRPLVTEEYPEYIIMGSCDISNEIRELNKYECPYKFGDISHTMIDTSSMSPNDLEEI